MRGPGYGRQGGRPPRRHHRTGRDRRSKPYRPGRLPLDAATSTTWGAPSLTSASPAERFYEVPGKRMGLRVLFGRLNAKLWGCDNYYTPGSVRGLSGDRQSYRDAGHAVLVLSKPMPYPKTLICGKMYVH